MYVSDRNISVRISMTAEEEDDLTNVEPTAHSTKSLGTIQSHREQHMCMEEFHYTIVWHDLVPAHIHICIYHL